MRRLNPSSTLINFLAFKSGWVTAVYGATHGMSWLGPAWILGWVTAFFVWHKQHRTEWILLLGGAAIGYSLDSILVLAGLIRFPVEAQLGGPSPLWMVAMWLNLSAALRYALGWLRDRFVLGAGLGIIFGPAAYLAGEKLGAIHIDGGLLPIALEWLIAIPILLYLERISRASDIQLGGLPHNTTRPIEPTED